jgi:hypothetical protein
MRIEWIKNCFQGFDGARIAGDAELFLPMKERFYQAILKLDTMNFR